MAKKKFKLNYKCSIKAGKIYGLDTLRNSIAGIEFIDIDVTITEITQEKTYSQIKSFYGPIIEQVQNCHLERGGEYFSKDKLKHDLKEKFLDKVPLYWDDNTPVMNRVEHPEKKNVYFSYHVKTTPSLSDLSKEQMTNFIEQIINHYWHEYNWIIEIDPKKKIEK